jgi:hypothetical protein
MSSSPPDRLEPREEHEISEIVKNSEAHEKIEALTHDQIEEKKENQDSKGHPYDEVSDPKPFSTDFHPSEEKTADGYFEGSPMNTFPTEEVKSLSIQGDFLNESCLLLNNKKHPDLPFNYHYRCLRLSENKLLFTGPDKNCFIYDTISSNYEIYPGKLNQPRELHAMAEIDGKVAVIGGLAQSTPLDSVEVSENDSFIFMEKLNRPRYGHSATTYQGVVWVVGGASAREQPENSIESYQNKSWTLIRVNQNLDRVGAGLTSLDNRILILGGFTKERRVTASVLTFDPVVSDDIKLSELRQLDFPCSFSLNLWNQEGSKLTTCSFLGEKVEYVNW